MEKWTGIAQVLPVHGNDLLGKSKGAYVGVMGVAVSQDDFYRKVDRAVMALDFRLMELSETKKINSSCDDLSRIDEILLERMHALNESNPIELGRFHAYDL